MRRLKLHVGVSLALLLGALSWMALLTRTVPSAMPGSPGALCCCPAARLPFGGARAACGQGRRCLSRIHSTVTQEAAKRLLGGGGSIASPSLVRGAECPPKGGRSPRAGQGQEPLWDATTPGASWGWRQRHLGNGERKFPEMTAIWEALQDIAPGNWRQELVQRLIFPVPEGGPWSASEMVEELRLFQAVSEHLLRPLPLRAPTSPPHWRLLTLLAVHGSSRLLQASLEPCSLGATDDTREQQQRASLAGSLMEIVGNLEVALQGGLGARMTALAVEAPLLSLSIRRLNSSQLGTAVLSFPSNAWAARVVLPEQRALDPFVPPDVHVDVQMGSFLRSPFLLSGTSTQRGVTGTVAELDLLVGGTEAQVSNLNAPVQIFLPQVSAALDWGPAVFVSPGKSLLLTVKGGWTGGSLGIHAHAQPRQPLGLFLLQWNQRRLEPSAVDPGGYSWLLRPEVLLAPEGAPRFLLVPLNLSAGGGLPVSVFLSAYGVQCLSWHQPSAQWTEDGCTVGPQTRPVAGGHCLCTHLSFFGASFWVAPVQVDLVRTAEYFGRVSKNPILAILLGVLYALYLAGLAWAHWLDMRDVPQVEAALLPEDDPCAQYGYLLRVGLQEPLSPGCSIGLCISLQGSTGASKPRHLPYTGTGPFLLREPCPLGELQSVWLWQESHGAPQTSWYISDVTVRDLPQRRRFYFPCHAWLATGQDGAQCFPAAPPEKAFWPVFRQQALRGLWEEQTVLLVLRPPPRSPFTRAQRLSCGWCLLLCSALISLMFWEVPQDDAPPLLRVGSVFSLSWKDVVTGVESALLAFPVNLLLVFIFQHAKPRRRPRGPGQPHPTGPSTPAGPTTPEAAVLEHLHAAIAVLSRGVERPEPWQLLLPSLGLEELLRLLGRLVLADGGRPRILRSTTVEPSAGLLLHEAYCSRYLLLKLQRVAWLLKEQDVGGPAGSPLRALQRVQEMTDALAAALPSAPHTRLKRQCPWRLPWWGVLVGWALLVSLSAVSTFFVLIYGFQYGKESTERWLVSTAVSLGQSLLVLQPLKVVCFAIFFALVLKKPEDEDPAEEGWLERLGSLQGQRGGSCPLGTSIHPQPTMLPFPGRSPPSVATLRALGHRPPRQLKPPAAESTGWGSQGGGQRQPHPMSPWAGDE